MVDSPDKTWSTGERNGKPPQYSCLENPMNCMKRQKDTTQEDEPTRMVGVQYATGEEQRNSSRKNEEAGPKMKGATEDEMVGWRYQLNRQEFEQTPRDNEGQESLTCCSP